MYTGQPHISFDKNNTSHYNIYSLLCQRLSPFRVENARVLPRSFLWRPCASSWTALSEDPAERHNRDRTLCDKTFVVFDRIRVHDFILAGIFLQEETAWSNQQTTIVSVDKPHFISDREQQQAPVTCTFIKKETACLIPTYAFFLVKGLNIWRLFPI